MNRLQTGIPGLDCAIGNGFVAGSINLVAGGPGTGKTVFALQCAYRQALAGKRVLIISENSEAMKADARSLGWDFDKHNCIFESFSEVGDIKTSMPGLLKDVSFVVIDTVSILTLAFSDNYRMRQELLSLFKTLRDSGCTTVLTAEQRSLSDSAAEFLADSIITLHNYEAGRVLAVQKMRRTSHKQGMIPFKITSKGIMLSKGK